MSDHCWHMRKAEVLPGKKKHRSLREDRCCFCGAEKRYTAIGGIDPAHGTQFAVYHQVTEDEEQTKGGEACTRADPATADLFTGGAS